MFLNVLMVLRNNFLHHNDFNKKGIYYAFIAGGFICSYYPSKEMLPNGHEKLLITKKRNTGCLDV